MLNKLAAAMLLSLVTMTPAFAEYPDKPITMMIAFGAGGATDTLGRLVASAVEKETGTPVVAENVTGGGGIVAATKLTKMPAETFQLLRHLWSLIPSSTLWMTSSTSLQSASFKRLFTPPKILRTKHGKR